MKHWAHGGETNLSNLVTLCRFHHRLVHEGRVVIQTLDDGAFRFIRPNGESFDNPAPIGTDWTRLAVARGAREIVITSETAITRWTGEAPDYDLAVSWLMQRRVCTGMPTS